MREFANTAHSRFQHSMEAAVDHTKEAVIRQARGEIRYAEEIAKGMWYLTRAPRWRRRIRWAQSCSIALDDLMVDRIEEVGLF